MEEPNPNSPATVPPQPEALTPVRKGMPVVIALIAIEARHDADNLKRQQEIAAEMQQLQAAEAVPGPEAAGTPPMTAAQRSAIYGDSPNAPQQTSNVSQAQAEAKQKELEREKLHQDALNSDTVAIDFEHTAVAPTKENAAVPGERQELPSKQTTDVAGGAPATGGVNPVLIASSQPAAGLQSRGAGTPDPMASYAFDSYEGRLYRVFEGTVLEGVVTNHISVLSYRLLRPGQ